jgi:putative ABC transport system substrate-binding protein
VLGYVEGRDLVIETRYAERQFDRLPALAKELVQAKVDVMVAITTPAALAAKNATATIPIVMAGSADPVGRGLVASLARPGGNITGVTNSPGPDFAGKQLQLLKEVAPRISRIAVLMDPRNPAEVDFFRAIDVAGRTLGVTPVSIEVTSPTQFDPMAITQARADALYVSPTITNWAHRAAIVDLAMKHRLPAMYGEREWVEAGGLMSYWTNWLDLRRHAAVFVDKILKGAKPADLPVEDPQTFELVINLKTAKALGLTIPQSVLARADEVIQ